MAPAEEETETRAEGVEEAETVVARVPQATVASDGITK